MADSSLMHDPNDDVGIAVVDLASGTEAGAVTLDGNPVRRVAIVEAIGLGRNPNVAAVVVIGIEPNWTERVVQGIIETGKPVAGFSIERAGDLKAVEAAAEIR